MDLTVVVWTLTALALVATVLTRLRLTRRERMSGVTQVSRLLVNVHTVAGLVAVVLWTLWLLEVGGDLTGLLALPFFWVATLIGLALLARWLPGGGRHLTDARRDRWAGGGPGLSVLAHVGYLAGISFFTWYFFSRR